MTLVVVQKTPIGIVAIADTRLTPPEKSGIKVHPYIDAALKLHILNSRIFWCFANSEYLAACSLEEINHRWPNPELILFDDLSDMLFTFCKKNIDIDFIIIDLASSDIRKITKNEVIKNCEKAYIGDLDAYRYYLNAYNTELEVNREKVIEPDTPMKILESSSMIGAFSKMIEKSGLTSVGGVPVRVMQEGDNFFYPPEVRLSTGYNPIVKNGKIDFSSVEYGCFAITTISGVVEGRFAFGLHFLTGDIALVWRCGIDIRPAVISSFSKKG